MKTRFCVKKKTEPLYQLELFLPEIIYFTVS